MSAPITIFSVATLALAACAAAGPPQHGPAPGSACDNSNIQQFVGREASPGLGAEMLRVSRASILRWVPHGTVITMEYRPDRLTVFLDAGNRVERIGCS